MRRVVLAPSGIPEDRLNKLRGAIAALQKDKTYKSLIKAIGENMAYVDGPEYEKLRPQQSEQYRELVKKLAGG
jgi:tripartite-type tricarboxylate transporter receptor subunit TctC